ncbi:protein kinase [Nocardiopsis sp. NPDC049922]|uniref:serine/threonine protein kinase n=1 Tax=Nocardiopsis sp. NPDC049922 TaxID=3155157 RepID=UPI0033CD0CEB
MDSNDPERIGRYRLISRLGAGGMGQVYLGRSAGGRAVAIKRIHPHMAADDSFRQRFAREVTAARQVSGAFTAPVIDAGPEDEVPWLVTSYVPSLPLDEAVRDHGPLPEASVRVLAAGLAEALAEIHRVGLIHRDLKPGNVLLAEDGPRVIDFGIARATDGTAATQSVIGTPGFMSPEQVEGKPLTPASDLFAYGAVLAFAATGTGPFGEGSMPTMVMRIISAEPDLSAVPEPLRHLVAACLSKDPAGRPGPGEILDHLGDVHAGSTWLPPAVSARVRERVGAVNQALAAPGGAGQAGATGGHQRTEVLGAGGAALAGGAAGAAAGAATGAFGDDQATRIAPPAASGGGDATAVYGQQGYQPTQHLPSAVPPASPPTAQYRQDAHAQPPTARYDQPAAPARGRGGAGDDDPYADLYGGHRPGTDARQLQQAHERAQRERERAEQESRRQQELHRQQAEYQQREQRRQYEDHQRQQQEARRRREAEEAHRERVRAERHAAQRAQTEARTANQPGVWGFVKLLPLLVLPLVQIPVGYGAALAWSWFTTETDVWTGAPYLFEPLSMDAFWHATMLGYFLFNNLISAEYLVRSLRTSFVTGSVLALAAIAATNGLLYSFGFWG